MAIETVSCCGPSRPPPTAVSRSFCGQCDAGHRQHKAFVELLAERLTPCDQVSDPVGILSELAVWPGQDQPSDAAQDDVYLTFLDTGVPEQLRLGRF